MLETAKEIWDFLHSIMELPPILILPVIIAVEGLAVATKLKNSTSPWRSFLLALYCTVSGIFVVFLTLEFSTWRVLVNKGLILGSVSALSYQMLKPVFKALVSKVYDKLNEKLGIEIQEEDKN
jgi:hypothetical protein